jgi:uncharacterized LabA/DUF88 family protein
MTDSSNANDPLRQALREESRRDQTRATRATAPSVLALPQTPQSNDDRANLFYAAASLGIEIDYQRLLSALTQGRRLLRAYFYTGVDPKNEKQRGFLLWLTRNGYQVVSKDLVPGPDGSRKASLLVELAVDMMNLGHYCETITLLSGDGHLTYAVEHLSRRGVAIEVVSLASMTSDALIDLADRYTDLATLQSAICKR